MAGGVPPWPRRRNLEVLVKFIPAVNPEINVRRDVCSKVRPAFSKDPCGLRSVQIRRPGKSHENTM